MTNNTHGISFGLATGPIMLVPVMRQRGRLDHNDYQVAGPLIEYYLNDPDDPDMKLLIDASRIKGWTFRASWDCLRLALRHGHKFTRIAILGRRRRHRLAVWISHLFMRVEVRTFDSMDEALGWLDENTVLPG